MGNDKNRGRPTTHDEPLQPAATRLPAAVIKWLLGRRKDENLSASMREQLLEDYEQYGKNWTTDD